MREIGEILQRLEEASSQYAKVRGDPEKQGAALWWGHELSLLEWVLGQEYMTRPLIGRLSSPQERQGEHFTETARHTLSLAAEEARRLKHNFVGTEHLLLGLIRGDGDTIAKDILKRLGVDLDKARATVEEVLKDRKSPGA